MAKTGLLILTSLSRIPHLLTASQRHVNQTLYIQLNLCNKPVNAIPARYNRIVTQIYSSSARYCSQLDVRVLLNNLRDTSAGRWRPVSQPIDVLLCENSESVSIAESLSKCLGTSNVISLESTGPVENRDDLWEETNPQMFKNVVLGGTFDRLHVGHKILLSTAAIRTLERLVVGVTDATMIKCKFPERLQFRLFHHPSTNSIVAKKLPELIQPVEQRIREVTDFLVDTDSTLMYEVVPIADPFGPTKSDPKMDMIVVSEETKRGGEKVNELRKQNGLNELDVYCIELVEIESGNANKELKVSSSNQRMDLLGSKLKQPQVGLSNSKSRACLYSSRSDISVVSLNSRHIDKVPPEPLALRNRSDRRHRIGEECHDSQVGRVRGKGHRLR